MKKKDPLSLSIDNVLPGVKQCTKNQTDTIYENGKSIKKVDIDICELLKLIQTQNVNGHITTTWESFTKYIGNYKPPLPVEKVVEIKDVSVRNVSKEDFSMDDMRNIPCRIKSFKELIIYHDRMANNYSISINTFDRRTQERYHRINNMMKQYYDCTDHNIL